VQDCRRPLNPTGPSPGLRWAGIELAIAEMKDPVKDKPKRFGAFAELGEHSFFPTIGVAVMACLNAHPVEWDDGESRAPESIQ
jgi:hypothetical protein